MKHSGGRMFPLVVGTVGLIACGILVLVLTYRHNLRLDLTPQRDYTLSSHARKILTDLRQDVRLTVFVRSEDPRTPELKDLLWRLTQETKRLSYEFVDLNRSPALAKQYGVDRYGAIVVETDTRRRDVSNPTEALLMGALLAVTRDRERFVYFVTGHGEHSPEDGDRKTGMSLAKRTLEDDQFTVRLLPLMRTEAIPVDATVVVIAGPRKDYLPGELAQIDGYLRRAGNLLMLLDPESPPSVAAFATTLGVTTPAQVVVDPERRLAGGEGVTVMVSDMLTSFLVSGSLEAPPVFSYARPLMVADPSSSSVIRFLNTSASSYTAPPSDIRARADGQPTGPLLVGAAVVPTEERGGRLIILGDSDFASNGIIDYLGNKDLFVNSINWLARDESLLSARAQSKEVGREQFFVTETQGAWSFWLATVLQPAVFFGTGTWVFLREATTMTWRRVAMIYAVLVGLAGYLLVFEQTEPEADTVDARSATSSILGTESSSVTIITFRKAGKIVRATRQDHRWRAIEPPGAVVSPDLFEATIATLTAGQASETLSHEPEAALSAYGLDTPSATVEVVINDAPERSITVLIGARNPTQTAVYARRSDQTAIFLVGMNLSYYIDLIFDAAKT